MEEVIRFVTLAQTDRFTLTDLCEQFGISRKTGYKHLGRHVARCEVSALSVSRFGKLKAPSPSRSQPKHVRS